MEPFLNWLWQGTAIVCVVAPAIRLLGLSAATRERLWWFTLAVVLLLPTVPGPAAAAAADLASSRMAAVVQEPLLSIPAGSAWRSTAWPDVLGALWLAWTGCWLARFGFALAGVRHARRRARPLPASREAGLARWNMTRGDRSVRLVVSGAVGMAAVLGVRRPVIAIAPAALASLTDRELDQVVQHELAHVRRHDPAALIVQRLVWALAGFHPAIWWLDRAITLDRELACDDQVLALVRPKEYAACLLKLAQAGTGRAWSTASTAPGMGLHGSHAALRIRLLLDARRPLALRASRGAMAAGCPAVLAVALALAGTRAVGAASSPDPSAMETAAPVAVSPRTPALTPTRSPAATRTPPALDRARTAAAVPADPPSSPASLARQGQENVGVREPDLAAAAVRAPAPAIAPPETPAAAAEPPPSLQASPLDPEWLSVARSVRAVAGEPALADPASSPWLSVAAGGEAAGRQAGAAGVRTGQAFARAGRAIAGAFTGRR